MTGDAMTSVTVCSSVSCSIPLSRSSTAPPPRLRNPFFQPQTLLGSPNRAVPIPTAVLTPLVQPNRFLARPARGAASIASAAAIAAARCFANRTVVDVVPLPLGRREEPASSCPSEESEIVDAECERSLRCCSSRPLRDPPVLTLAARPRSCSSSITTAALIAARFSLRSRFSLASLRRFARSAFRLALTLLMTTTTTNAMKRRAMHTDATTMSGTA